MAQKSKKERLAALTEAVNQAAANNFSLKLEVSSKNDEVDKLAAALNVLLEKALFRADNGKDKDATSDESEISYRNILDSMEEAYFEVDLKGNLHFFNDATLRDLGYCLSELKGVNFRKLVDEENARKVWENFHSVYLTGNPIKGFDWEIQKKDGGVIPVESSVSLLKDKQGNPIGFKGITHNITLRKQMEKELRQNEERYRTILDTMGEGYVEVDLKGNTTFANDAACRLTNYTREEAIGRNYRQYTTEQTATRMYEAYHRIYETGLPGFGLDFEIIRNDKTAIEIRQNAALRADEDGRPAGFRVLFRDVTEQKKAERALRQSEEKYRTILETMEETYLETDLKGNFLFFNDALCRVYGYPCHELKNINYRLCAPPESHKKLFEDFNEIYRTGKAKTFLNHPILTKDGSIKYLEMTISLLRNTQGEPIGFHGVARDVTDKLKAERAIRESEYRLRAITNNTRDVIWTMDFQMRFTYLSAAVQRMFGFTAEEIIKIPLHVMLPPEMYAMYQNALAEELAREQSGKRPARNVFQMQLLHKNGTPVWVEISADFNRDEKGIPFEIIGVTRDITERKKAGKLLAESEKRYRLIIENVNDIILTIDFNFNLTFISNPDRMITGHTFDEINKTPLDKLLAPESYQLVMNTFSKIIERIKTNQPLEGHIAKTMEIEVLHKNGSTIWAELNGSLIRDDDGRPVEILLTGRDITARKKAELALEESEKRYRMIVENMHDVIWALDLNLNFHYVSASNFRITGYTPEELQNISIQKILKPTSHKFIDNMLLEELASEENGKPFDQNRSRTFEIEIYRKDGEEIWLEVTAIFNRALDGKPAGIIASGRDITQRKKAEEEKEKLEKQLQQAQKLETVGRLAGGIAHDFNNMLNVILGYAELARLRLPPESNVVSSILEIEKAAGRSRDLTAQLLAFSRKQIISPKIVNLNKCIEQAMNTVFRLIGEDINLNFYPDQNLHLVKFDPAQFEQILLNLAVNARDAMPNGGKLTIETANTYIDEQYCREHLEFAPGNYVLLTVSDNGMGIDKAILPYIFDPFFTTKEVGKGTGLGLAMIYGIVKQHEGYINVYSEPNGGATFKIYLPVNQATAETADELLPPQVIKGEGIILMVEDDELLRSMISEMLEIIGYSVIAAANPVEALPFCENTGQRIDLLITDVVMPEMNGRELRDRCKVLRPDLKVLFMSGYTSNVIVHHGVLEEGVHFLQKPFSLGILSRKITEIMRSEKKIPHLPH